MKNLLHVTALAGLLTTFSAQAVDDEGWSPINIDSGRLTVEAAIADQPTKAVLNLGSNVNAISRNFADEHGHLLRRAMNGEEIRVTGASGTVFAVKPYINVPVSIMGYDTVLPELIPGGVSDAGLSLGEEFFDKAIVQLDFPNRRIRKLKRRAMKLKTLANVDARRAIAWSGGLAIKVTLDGEVDHWLDVSTGSSNAIVVPRGLAEKYGWLEKYPVKQTTFIDFNGRKFQSLTFSIGMLKVGPFTLADALINVPDEMEGKDLARSSIDLEVLQHFLVTMDAKKRLFHLSVPEE